jgi:hypothetical protein
VGTDFRLLLCEAAGRLSQPGWAVANVSGCGRAGLGLSLAAFRTGLGLSGTGAAASTFHP